MSDGPDHDKLRKYRNRIQVILDELEPIEALALMGSMLMVNCIMGGMTKEQYMEMLAQGAKRYEESIKILEPLIKKAKE